MTIGKSTRRFSHEAPAKLPSSPVAHILDTITVMRKVDDEARKGTADGAERHTCQEQLDRSGATA